MITHAASRKHYYTVLLDRTESGGFLFCSFLLVQTYDIVQRTETARSAVTGNVCRFHLRNAVIFDRKTNLLSL